MTNLLANLSTSDKGTNLPPENLWAHAGIYHPIELPFLNFNDVMSSIGEQIAGGDYGKVYNVIGTSRRRVYKVISADAFACGDEIRITEIAGKIGVAPTFHRAFLTTWSTKPFVFIQMDYGGKSLERIFEESNGMELCEVKSDSDLADATPRSYMPTPYFFSGTNYDGEEMTGICLSEIQPEKPSQEEMIGSVYRQPETFYIELFSRIKLLAENCISYTDTHFGNILLSKKSKRGLQLIDFDQARFHLTFKDAIASSLQSHYNTEHLLKFKSLEKLSKRSISLINFLDNQLLTPNQDQEAV